MNISAMLRPLIAGACLVAVYTPAVAQTPARAQTGDWVRVEMLGQSFRLEGRLMSVDGDSLIVAPGDSGANRVAVARANVTNVWVSIGRKRRTWQGIGIGLGVGAGVGALIAGLTYQPCVPEEFMDCYLTPESAGQAALLGGAAGGVFGIVLGGVAGFATRRHVWEPVGVPTTVGIAPFRQGGLAVTLRFRM
jgi:hypothetical protein